MRKIIFALAAILPAFGAAHAEDFFSTLQFPQGQTASSRHQHGDAAPRSVIANPERGMNFSAAAPMQTHPQRNGISSRYVYGDARPAAPAGTVSVFGYTSSAQMSPPGTSELGISPRLFDGSN